MFTTASSSGETERGGQLDRLVNFVRNAGGLLLTSGVMMPMGFITSVLLARYLVPEDRGLYSVATSFAVVAAILMQLGWPATTIYKLRRARSNPAQVAGSGLLLVSGVSVVVLPLVLLLEPVVVPRLLDDAPSTIFYLALASVPFRLLLVVFAAIARGIDQFRIQNVAHILQTVSTAVGVAVVVVLLSGGVEAVLWLLLVLQAAAALGVFTVVVRHTGLSLRVPAVEFRDGFRFGMLNYVEILATRLHERVDIFMLAYFLGDPAQVAYYTIAAGLGSQIRVVPESIGTAAFPQMAGQTNEESADFACKVSRLSFCVVLATAVAFAIIAPTILPLIFGEVYARSVTPFLVMLPGVVLLTIFRVLTRYFAAIDVQKPNVATQLISVVANIALNAVLIPPYGIVGAALASLASYTLQAFLITLVFRRVSGKSVGDLLVPRREDLETYWRQLQAVLNRARSSG
jgi:O-antigen/teichoic acid export membrane protein